MTPRDVRHERDVSPDHHGGSSTLAPERVRRVAVLGSTGSIGRQALDVIARNPDRFEVVALAARSNLDLLADQALAVGASAVAVAGGNDDLAGAANLAKRITDRSTAPLPEILHGAESLKQIAASADVEIVLNSVVGSAGLGATLAALRAGKRLALANKESLVAGGDLVNAALAEGGGELLPVDSEHAGLAQCIRAGSSDEVARMYLTASGGPFRGYNLKDLEGVSVKDALAHPTWTMGRKITIDSATLMNKGLEAIEAHVLFDLPYDQIGVVVHPQSVVHAMVEFIDGSTIAQVAMPNMEAPIGFALGTPHRLDDCVGAIDWSKRHCLEFEPVDMETFRCLRIAIDAGIEGGTAPAIMNAANEEAVAAFLAGEIAFTSIPDAIEATLDVLDHSPVRSDEDLYAVEVSARETARTHVARLGQN